MISYKYLLFLTLTLFLNNAVLNAEAPSMSMTNPETGEVTTVTMNPDGTRTVTVTDSSGNITSSGAPTWEGVPVDQDFAIRKDGKTGETHVSIEADDQVIDTQENFDPDTGMTTTTNILDPTIDGGRASYVIRPDGTQESLVGLPGDTAAAISTDPITGDRFVSIENGEGGRTRYVIHPNGKQEDNYDFPEGASTVITTDPKTGKKKVFIKYPDGTVYAHSLGDNPSQNAFGDTTGLPLQNSVDSRGVGFEAGVTDGSHTHSKYPH